MTTNLMTRRLEKDGVDDESYWYFSTKAALFRSMIICVDLFISVNKEKRTARSICITEY